MQLSVVDSNKSCHFLPMSDLKQSETGLLHSEPLIFTIGVANCLYFHGQFVKKTPPKTLISPASNNAWTGELSVKIQWPAYSTVDGSCVSTLQHRFHPLPLLSIVSLVCALLGPSGILAINYVLALFPGPSIQWRMELPPLDLLSVPT